MNILHVATCVMMSCVLCMDVYAGVDPDKFMAASAFGVESGDRVVSGLLGQIEK